jgi:hypothetical protein
MEELLKLFKSFNDKSESPLNAIEIHDDGSGRVINELNEVIFDFRDVEQLEKRLTPPPPHVPPTETEPETPNGLVGFPQMPHPHAL